MTAKIGVSVVLGELLQIFVSKTRQNKPGNSGRATLDISFLQKKKKAFLNKMSASRGDFHYTNDWNR